MSWRSEPRRGEALRPAPQPSRSATASASVATRAPCPSVSSRSSNKRESADNMRGRVSAGAWRVLLGRCGRAFFGPPAEQMDADEDNDDCGNDADAEGRVRLDRL